MKKKTIIKGVDIVRSSGGFMPPAFRSGKYMTEKDRPRTKMKPRDYDKSQY